MITQYEYVEGTIEELAEVLRREFDLARGELAEAVRSQQRKDTPIARQRVAECRSELDVILDLWNAVRPAAD